jgi:hypothetical protein
MEAAAAVSGAREPVDLRVATAAHPPDLLRDARVIVAMTAAARVETGGAAEIAADSGDAMTAIAGRATRLRPQWPG